METDDITAAEANAKRHWGALSDHWNRWENLGGDERDALIAEELKEQRAGIQDRAATLPTRQDTNHG